VSTEPQQQMIIQEDVELDQKMNELLRQDSTVFNAYKTGELLGMSKMKLYMNLVLLLAQEKKTYFDMAVDAKSKAMPDPLFRGKI